MVKVTIYNYEVEYFLVGKDDWEFHQYREGLLKK